MTGVIDSHIHLDGYDESERKEIIDSLENNNIQGLIAVSNDLKSLKKLMKIANHNEFVKPCAGYHPEQELPNLLQTEVLFDYIKTNHESIYGIGEVGLPYYLQENDKFFNKDPYIYLLEKFITLAKELDKPLNIHAVYEDTKVVCELLEKHDYHKAHFHWAKTDFNTLELMVKKGYMISITPDIIYKERTRELVKFYPLDLMMVETDGPWRYEHLDKAITQPKMLYDIIEQIAHIKNSTQLNVEQQILKNTKQFYKL